MPQGSAGWWPTFPQCLCLAFCFLVCFSSWSRLRAHREDSNRTLPPAQGIVNMRSGRPSCRLRWGFCSSTCFARMHPGAGGPPWGGKGEANGILQEALHVAAPCPLLGGPGSWLQWLVKPKRWLALPCLSLRWTQSWAPGCTEQYWMSVSVWLVQSFGKATWAGGNDWAHMGYQENTWLTSQL